MCRDLASAMEAWEAASATSPVVTALLHVGFARPDTAGVQVVLGGLPNGLYVTEAARYALPRECAVSGREVGRCEGRDLTTQALYRGIGLWLGSDLGADADASVTTQTPAATGVATIASPLPAGWEAPLASWLTQLNEVDVEASAYLKTAGVRTDEDFLRVRAHLPHSLRVRTDRHRFRALTERIAPVDPFAIAPFLPDWACSAQLSALGLSRRCTNVFGIAGLQTVADVLALGPIGIMSLRNFGRTSLSEFVDKLYVFVGGIGHGDAAQPATSEVAHAAGGYALSPWRENAESNDADASLTPTSILEPPSLRAALEASLADLRERDAEVMRLWLGMDGPPRILEDIGGALGVTRERARQIRNRGWERIRQRGQWPGEVVRRVEDLLSSREEPLYLDMIVAEDAWFDGFQDNLTPLARVIEEMAGDMLHVWGLNGRLNVTRCRAEQWGELVGAAQSAAEQQISVGVTRSDARILIGAVAVAAGAPELGGALRQQVEPVLHFAVRPNGQERLVSIGRGLRHALTATLDESDRPLHMSEIVERLRDRGCVDRNDYGVQNMVRAAIKEAGGMLYGRSLYGLNKHLPVAEDAAEEALAELEAIMLESAPGRQWHCSELTDELTSRRPDLGEELDQFTVNVILTRSRVATYLGRLVWVGTSQADGLQERLDVAAMCEAALLQAGRPLSKRELRDTIRQVRGLNRHFLPQASERVVRLAYGMWGLADRDVGVSAENRKVALDALHRVLEVRQRGLHVSELFEALREVEFIPDPELDEWELLGIAQSDARFRIGRGQLIGLPGWADVRRRSIGQALAEVQACWQGPATGEVLHAAVCALTERMIPRATVASHAARAGFVYDAARGLWDIAETAQVMGIDVEDES